MLSFLDEEWVNSMMAKIDLNGDGGISVEEFVELNMRLVKYIKKNLPSKHLICLHDQRKVNQSILDKLIHKLDWHLACFESNL